MFFSLEGHRSALPHNGSYGGAKDLAPLSSSHLTVFNLEVCAIYY